MQILKIAMIAVLGLLALKVGFMVLGIFLGVIGLAGALLHIALWVAVLYLVGTFIWKLIKGSKANS